LADKLAQITPDGIERFFFCSGGSEALDTVLKLTRAYWLDRGQPERTKVIGRMPSFHGATLAALSVGYHAGRRKPYAPYLLQMPHLACPWVFRCEAHGPDGPYCDVCSGAALDQLIKDEGPETVAAFIAEPIVGAAAPAVTPPPGYFERIREICDRYDILLISDEVMTGFGRTGRMFGIEHWDAKPDLIMMAKALGAGFAPIAAVGVHDRVIDTIRRGTGRFEHGYTMGGNPLSCAVACAVLDAYEREQIVQHVREVGPVLAAGLESLRRHALVGDVRGRGLMLGLELTRPGSRDPLPIDLHAAQLLEQLARDEGLLVYGCSGIVDGQRGDAILMLPPLTLSTEEAGEVVARLDRALAALSDRLEAPARAGALDPGRASAPRANSGSRPGAG
jgi:adenosylmethionine-8-amino-7-oxononanoate aminotransferase